MFAQTLYPIVPLAEVYHSDVVYYFVDLVAVTFKLLTRLLIIKRKDRTPKFFICYLILYSYVYHTYVEDLVPAK